MSQQLSLYIYIHILFIFVIYIAVCGQPMHQTTLSQISVYLSNIMHDCVFVITKPASSYGTYLCAAINFHYYIANKFIHSTTGCLAIGSVLQVDHQAVVIATSLKNAMAMYLYIYTNREKLPIESNLWDY